MHQGDHMELLNPKIPEELEKLKNNPSKVLYAGEEIKIKDMWFRVRRIAKNKITLKPIKGPTKKEKEHE